MQVRCSMCSINVFYNLSLYYTMHIFGGVGADKLICDQLLCYINICLALIWNIVTSL